MGAGGTLCSKAVACCSLLCASPLNSLLALSSLATLHDVCAVNHRHHHSAVPHVHSGTLGSISRTDAAVTAKVNAAAVGSRQQEREQQVQRH